MCSTIFFTREGSELLSFSHLALAGFFIYLCDIDEINEVFVDECNIFDEIII